MAKFAVMSNVGNENGVRVYYPNTNYDRDYAIEQGFFSSYNISWGGKERIYEKDLFNTHKEAKKFQKNCDMAFPETIVQEIDENDPRLVRA